MKTNVLQSRRCFGLGLGACLALWAGTASAQSVKYEGIHPRTAKPEGGLCTIKGVHLHALAPALETLFRKHGAVYVFVGDPVPFGFEGQRYRFYGHHPLTVSELGDEVSYCYLNGPHWHSSAPANDSQFVARGDVFYYAGDFPQTYQRERARFEVVNGLYLSFTYERPVVVTAPPPEYRGPVIEVRVPNWPGPPRPAIVIEDSDDEDRKHRKFKHKKFKGKKFKSRD